MAWIHAAFRRPPPQKPTYIYIVFSKRYIYVCVAGHARAQLALFRLPWHSFKNVGIRGGNTPNASVHAG